MEDHSSRRRFLQLTSSAALVGLAGCSGGGQGESTEGESMEESTEGDSMTDESMDNESMTDESMENESM
ncbi:MAG: twin-arginine translocation signal domain-containing protein, partial [Halolamina sp.]